MVHTKRNYELYNNKKLDESTADKVFNSKGKKSNVEQIFQHHVKDPRYLKIKREYKRMVAASKLDIDKDRTLGSEIFNSLICQHETSKLLNKKRNPPIFEIPDKLINSQNKKFKRNQPFLKSKILKKLIPGDEKKSLEGVRDLFY